MTENMKNRIQEYLAKDVRSTFFERITYQMECENDFRDLSFAQRYGETFKYILERISTPACDDELLVGRVQDIVPTKEQEAYVNHLTGQWWNKSPEEIQKEVFYTYSFGWLRRRASWFFSLGHVALDYETLIRSGLGSLREKASGILESGIFESDGDKTAFLQGAVLCYDALTAYIDRYANAMQNETLAASLRHIAAGKPRTFAEALQLIWLVSLPSIKVAGCGVLCYGRMDQYLLPFYQNDVKNSMLTPDQAVELLEEFFFKNNEIMSLSDHMSEDSAGTSDTLEVIFDDPNYVIIGGLLSNGKSGVNDLSHLMVRANQNLGLKNPFMVVRYHDGMDDRFWLEVCDALRQNTSLVVYNDETMIKALKSYGVDEPEVYDYGFFGCNDPIISTYEGGLRQLWFNLPKALELALNQGDYPMLPRNHAPMDQCQFSTWDRMTGLMTGAYYGKETKPPGEMASMADVIDAFQAQVRFLLDDYIKGIIQDLKLEESLNKGHIRIEDCFLKGTIENAIDWNSGGTKYHKYVAQGVGLANVVNSLYAIEEIVFMNQEYSLDEFMKIVSSNFRGHKALQNRLKYKIKKYGNDFEEVDKYARMVVDIFYDEVMRINQNKACLYKFWPTLSSDRAFTEMGLSVGATPDGRNEREPLSENQSPAEGTDHSGITAMLNSVAWVPYEKISGGPLNIKLHPDAIKGEDGLQRFSALLKTYFQNGGMQAQINILDKDMLIAAQQNPLMHKGLCVRVTGYSAFFVQMGKKAQDELIKRTEML